MTEITVANTEWEIIEDLQDALKAATITGQKAFPTVTASTRIPQFEEAQYKNPDPVACVMYNETEENHSPENSRGCAVSVNILVATKVNPKIDESDRLKEALRLMNAAKNAVEATPPSDAHTWGDGDYYQRELEWDTPAIDLTESDPWITVTIPLAASYLLSSPTSH